MADKKKYPEYKTVRRHVIYRGSDAQVSASVNNLLKDGNVKIEKYDLAAQAGQDTRVGIIYSYLEQIT